MASTEWVNSNPSPLSSFFSPAPTLDYKNTKFYNCIINHEERSEISNKLLASIIETQNLFHTFVDGNIIINGYKILFDKNLFDIIYEIIDGSNSLDEFVICIVAIDNENYDVLNFAISKGFDINNVDPIFNMDLLQYAVGAKNLSVCKYLMNEGANPLINNHQALVRACVIEPDDILEYFLELDNIKNEHLEMALSAGLRTQIINKNKIKMILDRGLDLNILDQKFFDMIAGINIDHFKFLFENGFEFNSNILLGSACKNDNIELVKICLENGLRPNNAILEKVLNDFNLQIIKLFLQYDIDFSSIKVMNEFDDLILQLEEKGLDRANLLNIIMKMFSEYYPKYYYPKHYPPN